MAAKYFTQAASNFFSFTKFAASFFKASALANSFYNGSERFETSGLGFY